MESEGAREGGREDQSCKGGGDSAEKTSLQRQPTLPAPIKEGRSCLLHADCSQRCAAELGKLQATSSVCSPSSAGTGSVNPGDCHPSPRAQCPPPQNHGHVLSYGPGAETSATALTGPKSRCRQDWGQPVSLHLSASGAASFCSLVCLTSSSGASRAPTTFKSLSGHRVTSYLSDSPASLFSRPL